MWGLAVKQGLNQNYQSIKQFLITCEAIMKQV